MSSITREELMKMDWKSVASALKDPATQGHVIKLMKGDRELNVHIGQLLQARQAETEQTEAAVDAQLNRVVPPSTEALAAEAAAMAAEPVVVEPVVHVAEASPAPVAVNNNEVEDAEWKAVGVTVVRDANGKATRYIEEYQVRDEDGTPIGRPTHLEARTLPELASKKRDAHENATRAFHRLKKQKLTFKQEPKTVLTPEQIAEAARIALEEKNPAKITDVIKQVIESEYQQTELTIQQKKDFEDGRSISNEFMRRHLHDYNPCDANKKELTDYFVEKNLDFTLDNLEAAFLDLMDQNKLVKVETPFQRTAVEVANPTPAATVATPAAPAIPVAEPPAAVPTSALPAVPPAVVELAVIAPTTTPAAAPNVQPAARRPGVNGSLPPGTLSAQRPGVADPALTRKEFLQTVKNMEPELMKKKLKTDPQFVKQLESYGIRVR